MNNFRLLVMIFFVMISFKTFLTPTNDVLEITAHLCQLSQPKEKCYCSEEMEEAIWFLAIYRLGIN